MSSDDIQSASESERWARLGASIAEGFAQGIEKGARETEGMTWEERVRYLLANTSPEAIAHAELVARRSFSALYEDEGGDGRLSWHYGPTATDPDPGKMWCDDCGGEVSVLEGVCICSCGRQAR